MKGWHKESYRHYLAAKGIKTKRYVKNKYFMASTYNIPHWLLDKLDGEEREEAEKMLFEDKENTGAVAKHFGIKHPSERPKRPEVKWSDEEKLTYLKTLGEDLGRRPFPSDVPRTADVPSVGAIASPFGGWSAALRRAGFEDVKSVEFTPVDERIAKLGRVPTIKDVQKESTDRHIERNPDYYSEYRENYEKRPGYQDMKRANRSKYLQIPGIKDKIKEYHRKYQQTDEYKLKRNKMWEDPEFKAKRNAYLQKPEVKARRARDYLRYKKAKEDDNK